MASSAAHQDANMAAINALMPMSKKDDVSIPTDLALTDATAPTNARPVMSPPPAALSLVDFKSLAPDHHSAIYRITQEISLAWSICSQASVFPYEYNPDPDPNNWGSEL
jgi:hypothetical protein